MQQFELPFPPSVNHYWRRKGSQGFLTQKGKQYRIDAAAAILSSHVDKVAGKCRVQLAVYPPDRRKRDLDNICKAVLDALEANGVITDDANIDDLHIKRCDVVEDGAVIVRVSSL